MSDPNPQQPPKPITLRQVYNNFFLISDFLQNLCHAPPKSADFFDMQYQIDSTMKRTAKFGGTTGQLTALGGLVTYFLKGRSVGLRFVYGFLYFYWINHFYTLGSYCAGMLKLPSVCRIADSYYLAHPEDQPNKMLQLRELLDRKQQIEDLLSSIFEHRQVEEERHFVANTFFIENREKYFPEGIKGNQLKGEPNKPLKHFDSFLTRYVYHTFRRWCIRVGQWSGYVED